MGFGAKGIGLCRTEHMFFEGRSDRRHARDDSRRENEDRKKALAKLLPYQREILSESFGARWLPATIRFLDPPLHEFLPHDHGLAERPGATSWTFQDEKITKRVNELHEFNPMLGHRGCRLGIVYPEISEMQARAVFRGGRRGPERRH